MAETLTRKLRIEARRLGVPNVRELSRGELEDAIEERKNGRSRKRGGVVKAVKKAKRGRGRPPKAEKPRRGRPPGSKSKVKRGPGRPPKAVSEKRTTTRRKRSSNGVGRPVGSGTGTRVALNDRINWDRDFDFRDGSTSQYILTTIRKSAKKYKDTADIREDVFDRLYDKIGDIDELTFMNRSTGRPHKGDAAEKRLQYYINRAMFDYAVQTGQHEGSGNSDVSQPREAPKRRGRPPKSETVKKRGRGRPRKVQDEDEEEEAPRRRRGRPKGSKNRAKATPESERPRRGRPPGSKSKKRGPGRPKGSKNRSRR